MNLSDAYTLTMIITAAISACIAIGGIVAKVRHWPRPPPTVKGPVNWIRAHLVLLMLALALLFGIAALVLAITDGTSRPPLVAKVATDNALDVTYDRATLNGHLETLKGGHCVKVSFEWGTDETYGQQTKPVEMTQEAGFSADLGGLEPNTVYHFRAMVVGDERPYYGGDRQFRTDIRLEVITNEADSLAPNSCSLHGRQGSVEDRSRG